jgi:hypothetical protein
VQEVQSWESGLYRDGFSGADQLRQLITRRLHEWELANAVGPVNESHLLAQALSLLPEEDRGHYRSGGRSLVLAIAAGPSRAILRPSELENSSFQEVLMQLALFGPIVSSPRLRPRRQILRNTPSFLPTMTARELSGWTVRVT